MGCRGTSQLSKRLLKDASGNILPMAAMSVIVMAALVGGGVDMSRAYKVQNRLQNACDAGVLAGRKAVTNNGFDATAQTEANRYFNINFDEDQQGTHTTQILFAGDSAGNSIGGKASTQMPMLIMQLFGKYDMIVSVNCASTMGVGNSDVTMVLDTTGSMGWAMGSSTRIAALKTAMKNFYSSVATASQGTNARVRYAFVPFSMSVNVGRLLNNLDSSYITDAWTLQSREASFRTITVQVFDGWDTPVITSNEEYVSNGDSNIQQYNSTQYNTLNLCTSALPANVDWANNGSPSTGTSTTGTAPNPQVQTTTTGQPQRMTTYLCQKSGSKYRRYYYYSYRTYYTYSYATSAAIYHTETQTVFDHWTYKPVQYDTSRFKTFAAVTTPTGSSGTNVSSTWTGCIEERKTVQSTSFSFSALTNDISPGGAYDLDIDMAPTSDPETQWAPLWPKASFYRNSISPVTSTSNSGNSQTEYCPQQARSLDEMTQSEFNSYADSLYPLGGTYLDIGMIWGARLSSPDGIFQDTVNEAPTNGGSVTRHIIFMTDGQMDTDMSSYTAYGVEYLDRRVTSNGSKSTSDSSHSSRFRAVCEAAKAKGIRVWTIQFDDTQTTMQADLSACASANSAFLAKNAAQLNAVFQEIAKQVGELRVLS